MQGINKNFETKFVQLFLGKLLLMGYSAKAHI